VSAPSAGTWFAALRPKTLGASLCPVAMGAALAWHDGAFAWLPVLAALAGACLLQVASNFANDLYDALRGTDGEGRIGPPRAVAGGLVSPRAMRRAIALVLALAAVPAGYLAWRSGWAFAAIGVAGAVCAVGYTAPPLSLAYRGLGEAFVFLFFGPLAESGKRAACDGDWTAAAAVCGIAPGAIGVALLATNNLRDRAGDEASGKRTLVVRLGERFGRAEIAVAHGLAAIVPFAAWILGVPRGALAATLLAMLVAPLSLSVLAGRDGPNLNKSLAGFGALLYLYGVVFAIGVVVSGGAR
jgi:1,4-dihydroxy-2-naphthoate octaprenyltransferase